MPLLGVPKVLTPEILHCIITFFTLKWIHYHGTQKKPFCTQKKPFYTQKIFLLIKMTRKNLLVKMIDFYVFLIH